MVTRQSLVLLAGILLSAAVAGAQTDATSGLRYWVEAGAAVGRTSPQSNALSGYVLSANVAVDKAVLIVQNMGLFADYDDVNELFGSTPSRELSVDAFAVMAGGRMVSKSGTAFLLAAGAARVRGADKALLGAFGPLSTASDVSNTSYGLAVEARVSSFYGRWYGLSVVGLGRISPHYPSAAIGLSFNFGSLRPPSANKQSHTSVAR